LSMDKDLSQVFIRPEHTIRQAIACIDRTPAKIALVLDGKRKLLDTITDGDVRRAILRNIDLDETVDSLLKLKLSWTSSSPVSAPFGTEHAVLLQMMKDRSVRHIPLVDESNRVVDLVKLDDLLPGEALPMQAVVMVGGFGTRLSPLTEEVPKPMLPIGNRPLLEFIIDQLRQAGIPRVNLATHYKQDIITKHFGNGDGFGIEIQYVQEDQPLGTAGALALLKVSDEPLLVINGDILTKVDFQAMLDFHRQHNADMTVAVRQQEIHLPYGVVETDGVMIHDIVEKPVLRHLMNAGFYLLNPQICQYIPAGQPYDMPDLILRLVSENLRVVSFPVREYWLDIGQHGDYAQALADAECETLNQ